MVSLSINELIYPLKYKKSMTYKSETLYKEASKTFNEYGDGCELDMLDNLYDLLKFVTDDFLDLFFIEYNTETEHWDEEDLEEGDTQTETYEDPMTTFRLKSSPCVYFDISCRGFERCDSAYYPCEVNANNESIAKSFYEDFCNKFLD